ncbi:tRNA:rRNA methyltransferase, partial [human gut metagenome]
MENNLIFGIRPVAEAIEAGKQIEKLYIRKGAEGQLMQELKDLCLRHRLRWQEVPVEKLNRLVRGNRPRGWWRRPPRLPMSSCR